MTLELPPVIVPADGELLTLEEAAARLRVSRSTVQDLIALGRLVSVRVGTRGVRVSGGSVAAYLEAQSAALAQALPGLSPIDLASRVRAQLQDATDEASIEEILTECEDAGNAFADPYHRRLAAEVRRLQAEVRGLQTCREHSGQLEAVEGLIGSLRDTFASQALIGLLAHAYWDSPAEAANSSYRLADAMLAERQR